MPVLNYNQNQSRNCLPYQKQRLDLNWNFQFNNQQNKTIISHSNHLVPQLNLLNSYGYISCPIQWPVRYQLIVFSSYIHIYCCHSIFFLFNSNLWILSNISFMACVYNVLASACVCVTDVSCVCVCVLAGSFFVFFVVSN